MLECPGTGGLEEGGQRRSTRIEAKGGKETFLTERGVRVHTLPSTQGRPRGSQAPLHPSSSVSPSARQAPCGQRLHQKE